MRTLTALLASITITTGKTVEFLLKCLAVATELDNHTTILLSDAPLEPIKIGEERQSFIVSDGKEDSEV